MPARLDEDPNYLLPSVRTALEQGRPYRLLAVAVAGWIRFLRGQDYAGEELPVAGPRMHLVDVARKAGTDPQPVLDEYDVFGDVGRHPEFSAAVRDVLVALDDEGPVEVVQRVLRTGAGGS